MMNSVIMRIIFPFILVVLAPCFMATTRYDDALDDYFIRPGMNLNPYPSPSYENYNSPLIRYPKKVYHNKPEKPRYEDSPGAGYGPEGWKGRHIFHPKPSCGIHPTPAHTTTVKSYTSATPPSCSTIKTTVFQTKVAAYCAQTTGVSYIGQEPNKVTTITVATPCTPISIRTSACHQDEDEDEDETTTDYPCYTSVITRTVYKSKTCTANVQLTRYIDVKSNAQGSLTSSLGGRYPDTAVTGSCTVPC